MSFTKPIEVDEGVAIPNEDLNSLGQLYDRIGLFLRSFECDEGRTEAAQVEHLRGHHPNESVPIDVLSAETGVDNVADVLMTAKTSGVHYCWPMAISGYVEGETKDLFYHYLVGPFGGRSTP